MNVWTHLELVLKDPAAIFPKQLEYHALMENAMEEHAVTPRTLSNRETSTTLFFFGSKIMVPQTLTLWEKLYAWKTFNTKKLQTIFSSYKIWVLSKNGVRIAAGRLIKVLDTMFCDKQEKLSTFQNDHL